MSGYVVLPFPGAWIDQPTWIKDDFLMLLSVNRWHRMNEKLPVAPVNLPRMEDAG